MKVAITPSKLSSQDITSANKFTQVLEKNINSLIFSWIANTLVVHLPVEVGWYTGSSNMLTEGYKHRGILKTLPTVP